ncbi:alpha/beta-hydrolase [Microstroma glucosiphilum]|uniref:Alpha/beta-hydrolase n=1 Tax=Pseudomicrostroma glucosiphilum TaxID=1684307 RepID=A0A316U2T8_9BASI|nr:alpha/beta-hydrolase [Pseudomicrostroma glucosiphilum]PWN19636.1 alpha/beta-hydrolase [Pseudomicrostroma glucosiphilum]
MSSVLGAFPAIVNRSVLSPLKILPKKFTSTRFTFGDSADPAQDSAASPPLFTSAKVSDLIKEVPSIESYSPHPLLPLGSLQTIYSAFADTVQVDVVHFKRHVLLLPDGGTLACDVSPPEFDEEGDGKRNTVVINHGLTGGSHESYVRHVIPPLVAAGYRCVVVNFRGCGQTPLSTPQLYSAAKTDDLRCGLLWVTKRFPSTSIVLIGFSLGANVVAKYLGEEGANTPVKGGMVLATPFDLKIGSDALASSALYDRVMSSNLTKKCAVHSGTIALDPAFHAPLRRLIDPKKYAAKYPEDVKQRGVKPGSLKWVDDTLTRLCGGHVAPYGGFPYDSADHYYTNNGSILLLDKVARPLLCLNSDDDPIVPMSMLKEAEQKVKKNSNVVLAITPGGGHLGLWTSPAYASKKETGPGAGSGTKPVRWLGPVAKEWVKAVFDAAEADGGKWRETTDLWSEGKVREVHDVEYDVLCEEEVKPFDFNESNGEEDAKASKERRKREAKADAKALKDELPAGLGSRLPSRVADGEPIGAKGVDTAGTTPSAVSSQGTSRQNSGAATPASFSSAPSSSSSTTSTTTKPVLPTRMAWLLTPLLPDYPLYHPLKPDEPPAFPAHAERRLKGTMRQCVSLPQVGFLELPESTRVAGVGKIFQGGISIEGLGTNVKGERVGAGEEGKKKGVWAQWKGSQPGQGRTVAGL